MPIHEGYPELNDKVVMLRRWQELDLECIRLAATDPDIPTGTTVPAVFTPDEGLAFIHRQWGRLENDEGISMAIAEVQTDTAVGLVVLLRHQYEGVYGIGYWLIPGARGSAVGAIDLGLGNTTAERATHRSPRRSNKRSIKQNAVESRLRT